MSAGRVHRGCLLDMGATPVKSERTPTPYFNPIIIINIISTLFITTRADQDAFGRQMGASVPYIMKGVVQGEACSRGSGGVREVRVTMEADAPQLRARTVHGSRGRHGYCGVGCRA